MRRRSPARAHVWLWVLAALLLVAPMATTAAQTTPPYVVIVNSYHQGYSWSDDEVAGVLAAMREQYPTFDPPIEYLDAKRFPDEEHLAACADHLRAKYQGKKAALVIALDNAALDMLLRYRDKLFPGAPIVFGGYNDYHAEISANHKGVTGVAQRMDIANTLKVALALPPHAREVLIVHDYTTTGQALRREAEDALNQLANGITVRYLPPATFDETLAAMQALTAQDLAIILSFITDREGRSLSVQESTRLLTQASPAPVYAVHEILLGSGVVGGYLLDGVAHGRRVGQMALRVLAGEEASSIPVDTSGASAPMFDYEQLKRFGISPRQLPPGSTIMNQPESFYAKNTTLVWGAMAVFGVLLMAVASLGAILAAQRRGEKALRRSEATTRALLDASPDTALLLDLEGRALALNETALARLNASPTDVIGQDVFKILPETVGPRRRAVFDEVIRTGQPTILEDERQGRLLSSRYYPVLDADSRVIAVAIYATDITERRIAERQHQMDDMRLEALLRLNQMTDASLSEIASFTMDEAVRLTESRVGYLAFVNDEQTMLTMYAWSQQAMAECAIQDKPLDYELGSTGLWGEAVRQRKPIITNDYAAPNPWKKGYPEGHVPIVRHMNVPIIEGDKVVAVAGVGNKETDYDEADVRQLTLLTTGMWRIIARKRAEESLRASQERYRLLFESGDDAIFVHPMEVPGGADFFVEVNDVACRRLGYTREELLRLGPAGIDGSEEFARVFPPMNELRAKGRLVFETTHVTKDGVRIPVEISAHIFQLEGEWMILSIARDLTERKRAEAERERLTTQLLQAQKMEAVGRLAGGVAHDLNNLLTPILGYTDLVLTDLSPDDQHRDDLLQVQRAAQSARDLTRQLLAFSRKQVLELQPMDLGAVVIGFEKILRRTIREDIQIALHLAPDLGPVRADASQIEQILMNLALNAQDAMPQGGAIIIETANVNLDESYAKTHPIARPGPHVMLAVSDTGMGMNAEAMAHLFEPFYTTKEPGKGTGLGLATVYGIVRQHGGSITAYSELGHGATFRIYLPRVDAPVVAPAYAAAKTQNQRGHETILVVEDNEMVRRMACHILQRQGYQVLSAATPGECLQLASEHQGPLHMVLTDVIMPGINGRQLYERLIAIRPGVKALFMSGYTQNVIAHQGVLEEGVNFLQKPFSPQSLTSKVREVLDLS